MLISLRVPKRDLVGADTSLCFSFNISSSFSTLCFPALMPLFVPLQQDIHGFLFSTLAHFDSCHRYFSGSRCNESLVDLHTFATLGESLAGVSDQSTPCCIPSPYSPSFHKKQ